MKEEVLSGWLKVTPTHISYGVYTMFGEGVVSAEKEPTVEGLLAAATDLAVMVGLKYANPTYEAQRAAYAAQLHSLVQDAAKTLIPSKTEQHDSKSEAAQ